MSGFGNSTEDRFNGTAESRHIAVQTSAMAIPAVALKATHADHCGIDAALALQLSC
jgi:hypothetical protein